MRGSIALNAATKTYHIKWRIISYAWIFFGVLMFCQLSCVFTEVIYRVDPLALLAATLRTYQRAGCDSEQLSLSCPRGTSISIELAQYGRAGDLSDHSLCPPLLQKEISTTESDIDKVAGSEIETKLQETCTVSGLQYTLLQTVVDACQKKRHCKFSANSKLSSRDPCSGIRKFIEIAYKCRPYEFRSKIVCENDNMPLVCNPYSRIAIYSASFGHTEQESVQCGNSNSLSESSNENNNNPTCLVSYATETVMQICHGRRRCSIAADAGNFGRPCKNHIKMYLKVVYTCIPRKVLKDRYESASESDEPQQSELDINQDELYDEDQFYKESEAIPPAPKLQGAIPNPMLPFELVPKKEDKVTTTLLPPLLPRNDSTIDEYQMQFYLYLIISIVVGIVLCMTVVIGRLALNKKQGSHNANISVIDSSIKTLNDPANNCSSVGDNTITKFKKAGPGEFQLNDSFCDDLSDIDADIDLTSPMQVPSLSSQNETFVTYAAKPNCTYGSLNQSQTTLPTDVITVAQQPPHRGGIFLQESCGTNLNSKAILPDVGGVSLQMPPATTICKGMSVCPPASASGIVAMGPNVYNLNTVSHQSIGKPSYLAGTMIISGHHHSHAGTLRRTLVPNSIGHMDAPSPPSISNTTFLHSGMPIPSASNVYYDSTMRLNPLRDRAADNIPNFYG